MTLINQFDGYDYQLVCGASIDSVEISQAFPAFSDDVINFFDQISILCFPLCHTNELSKYASFFFYARKKNLLKLKSDNQHLHSNVGLGLSFNIAPSNVPLNSLYSLLFTLISGSTCVLRVSQTTKQELSPFFEIINDIALSCFVKQPFSIISYERGSGLTSSLSSIAKSRVVWGGDTTADFIRKLPCPPSCRDIFFPNRLSCAVVDLQAFSQLNNPHKVLLQFAKDITMFSQQACSSPLHIYFILDNTNAEKRISYFFESLDDVISQHYSDSYLPKDCLESALNLHLSSPFLQPSYSGSFIRVFSIDTSKLDDFSGDNIRNGNLTYSLSKCYHELPLFHHFQTIVLFPWPQAHVRQEFFKLFYTQFDRLIPPGQAIDMHAYWDGIDIIGSLSRKIFY